MADRLTLRTVCAVWSCLLLAVSVAAADEKRPDRPNIILIMADDVGYECFGCYGSRQYRTPRIDRLAQGGMRFNHCYSQPLCTPSRVKLMTGVSNVRNYSGFSILNPNLKTIGHHFQKAGYETVIGGKWQLLGAEHYSQQFRGKGAWPVEAGFDHQCLWQVDRLGSRFWQPLLHVDGTNRQFPGDEDYGPEIVTRYITDYLGKRTPDDRPFFIYYPMILVHSPFLPTPDSESRDSKNKQRNFEDMVAYMDKLVGRIVDTTEELGIADDTLIVFTGDNGTHKSLSSKLNGRMIRGGKGSTTDAGTREPLVAYWPGTIPAGTQCDDLIDFTDFLPTLLQAAGEAAPDGLDGRSFLPQLKGQPGEPREWMFCYYNPRPERTRPVRFVRDQRWKLYGDGRFFDVANDVDEQHALRDWQSNPVAVKAHQKLQQALQSMPAEGQALLKFPPAD